MRQHEAVLFQAAASMNTFFVLFGVMAFLAAFHFSVGPVMWVLFSELFPTSIRSVAITYMALITSIVSFFVQQFFPWQLSVMGASSVFMIYGIFALIGLVVLTIILPETKNKSIEEIDLALNGKPV